jgi:protein TonB
MFAEVGTPLGPWHRRRALFAAASALGNVAVLVAIALLAPGLAPEAEPIAVRIVQPVARAAAPPPAAGKPPPPSRRTQARRLPPPLQLVQPKEVADTLPAPSPPEEPYEGPVAEGPPGPPGPVGAPDGVVGGAPVAEAPAPQPPPARATDLAAVRAGIARTLVYPPEARRREQEGRVVLSFILLADGTVADLSVRKSSGHAALDEAAMAAIRAAAPYPPPGLDVLVVVPVSFRLA